MVTSPLGSRIDCHPLEASLTLQNCDREQGRLRLSGAMHALQMLLGSEAFGGDPGSHSALVLPARGGRFGAKDPRDCEVDPPAGGWSSSACCPATTAQQPRLGMASPTGR